MLFATAMTEEIDRYIESHIDPEPDYLRQLDRDTYIRLLNPRMCSGHTQGRLLKMITRMISPSRALELGTFSGYSALCIAEGMPPEGMLETIEIDDELEDFITSHFENAPERIRRKIRLNFGDAKEFLLKLQPGFDMIFIDADKREYADYYALALRLLKEGGYILADNTLWDGHVAESERHDAQTEGIRLFNRIVAEDPAVEKTIIPIRDGLTLIYKKPSEPIHDPDV